MEGSPVTTEINLDFSALDQLMPMHLCLANDGGIVNAGPTVAKLFPDIALQAQNLFDLFDVKRPSGIADMAGLVGHIGERLYLGLRGCTLPPMRAIAVRPAKGQGVLLNLSFGIGVVNAVRHHRLTDADFAPTDLAVELLYLVEAKSAVMDELRDLNARLQGAKLTAEKEALTDTLTGLRNRRALDHDLNRLLRQSQPFGLMHIDLDYFKSVNDTLGHAAGDHVLQEVAKILSSETRFGDTVARVGGDEFIIVMPALADPDILGKIAQRIIAQINMPMQFSGKICQVAASIGMTISHLYPTPDATQMLNDADMALYVSKRAGRAQATLFAGHREAKRETGS